MQYILIIWLSFSLGHGSIGTSFFMQEFNSKEACLSAAAQIHYPGVKVTTKCLAKGNRSDSYTHK